MNRLFSINARTAQAQGEPIPASSVADVDRAVQAAADVQDDWAASTGAARGALLRALADALETDRSALVDLADAETGLGPVRLNGELDRTTFQLRRFAGLAEQGVAFAQVDDPAVAGAPPVGHPDMVRRLWPLGPVAMFAASNFPFAFSVLGGDTASALAAGCPVVVKAHPGHPALSQRVFGLIQRVLSSLGLPAGLVGLVQGAGVDVGVALVRHPLIQAAAFTGSTRGGLALAAQAQSRPQPIPFFGELGAVNPVVVLPSALEGEVGAALATSLAVSITLGCGQFCTNPGVIVLVDDPRCDAWLDALAAALRTQQPHVMLTAGMRRAFDAGIQAQLSAGAQALVHTVTEPLAAPAPVLAQVRAAAFVADPVLRDEVFGPSSLVVRCADLAEVHQVLQAVQGSLTVTLLGLEAGHAEHQALVRRAARIAGRVLFKGVPTGVAVTAAQHHGGPFPASTAPATTSVGDAALGRFLRPVCFQDAPVWLRETEGRPV